MFCCEPTGGYERTLLDTCGEEGQPVCLMNAQQVRCYAGNLGTLEKTDQIDARIISMAADDKKPESLVHADARQRKLKELWTLRTELVDERKRVSNQLEHLHEKESVAAVRKSPPSSTAGSRFWRRGAARPSRRTRPRRLFWGASSSSRASG